MPVISLPSPSRSLRPVVVVVVAAAAGGPYTVFAPTDSAFEDVDVSSLIANRTALTGESSNPGFREKSDFSSF